MLMDEGRVIFRADALEDDSEKVGIGFQNALSEREALHMLYSVDLFQHIHHRVTHLNGVGFLCLHAHEVSHLDVAAESDDLITDGLFESKDNTHGNQHHGYADGYTGCCDPDGRLRDFPLVIVVLVNPACKE